MLASALAAIGECVPMEAKGGGAMYVSKVSMGTPPQVFGVVPDTGSATLVAPSTLCKTPECAQHAKFNPNASSSFSADSWMQSTLTYGSGPIVVSAAKDDIKLGEHSASGVDVELINNAANLVGYARAPYDGIMGLGKRKHTTKSNANMTNQEPLLTSLKVNRFTVCLGSPKVNGTDTGGRLLLDSDLEPGVTKGFTPLAAKGQNMWAASLTSLTASNGSSDGEPLLAQSQRIVAVPDSGTSLITFPRPLFVGMMNAIEEGCAAPNCLKNITRQEKCSGQLFDQLPTIKLTLGGVDLSLSPHNYMGEMLVQTGHLKRVGPFIIRVGGLEGIRCVPLISGMQGTIMTNEGELVILGMPFFREYAVRFDRPSFGIEVAKIPVDSSSCNRCPARGTDIRRTGLLSRDAAGGALQPAAEDAVQSGGSGRSAAGNDASVPMLMEHLRFPWWALPEEAARVDGRIEAVAGEEDEADEELSGVWDGLAEWQLEL